MSELPPNISTERRVDLGSRKVIEHIREIIGHLNAQDDDVSKVTKALEQIRKDLKHRVTYQWLLTIAGGFGLAVLGSAWMMQDRALAAIEANRQQREAQIIQIRQETAATSVRIESKVDGLFKYFIEGAPKAAVRAEVRAEERAVELPLKPANPTAPTKGRP